MRYFQKTVNVDGTDYVVQGVVRDWNPLAGVDLELYPLPSEEVCELKCPDADNMFTWGASELEATKLMSARIRNWKKRKDD